MKDMFYEQMNQQIEKQWNQIVEKAKAAEKYAKDELEDTYLNLLVDFYNEYQPRFYRRHMFRTKYATTYIPRPVIGNQYVTRNTVSASGLARTYKSFSYNYRNLKMESGITLSPKDMYTDYRGTREDVFDSFMNGFHGPPQILAFTGTSKPGIKSRINVLDSLETKRQSLYNEIKAMFN